MVQKVAVKECAKVFKGDGDSSVRHHVFFNPGVDAKMQTLSFHESMAEDRFPPSLLVVLNWRCRQQRKECCIVI